MDTLRQDLRHALRTLRRSPGFAAVAILTLAVGLGAITTLFSVVDAVLLRPLPFRDADRLVHVWETNPAGEDFTTSEPNFLDFRDGARPFAALAAYRVDEPALTGAGEPERIRAVAATHGLFAVLGVAPALGRSFTAAEDRPGGDTRAVVLSDGLWRRRFGADPAVVGRTVSLDGEPFTVLGVMPAEFRFLRADAWTPLAPDPAADRGDHWLSMVGRLEPGAAPERLDAVLRTVAARIGAAHPEVAGWGVRVLPLREWAVDPGFRQASLLLLAAVGFLLLMACANVAGLLTARATARRTELGVRAALGAGRGRLARQMLTESLVLAALGAALGLLGAAWLLEALRSAGPALVPRVDEVALDARVLAFTAGATLVTTLLFGLLPAVQASRVNVHQTLKQTGRTGGTRGEHRVRDALVVAQVGLAVVLLFGAGLMARSLARLGAVEPGFRTERTWAVPLQVTGQRYAEPWQKGVFYRRVMEEMRSVPGVSAVGATSVQPFSGWNLVNDVTPQERAASVPPSGFMQAAWRVVTPGYFEAAGVPLLRGRSFGAGDTHESPEVAVVSRTMAERMWPGEDPIGKRFFWGGTSGTPRTVVGVVGDVRDVALESDPPPVLFLSHRQLPWPMMTVVARASGDVAGLPAALRAAVHAVDPDLPVPTVVELESSRRAAMAQPRLQAWALGAFAAVALLLAGMGIYGVLAFTVAQRTREIGVRMALGARSVAVVGALVRRGMALVAAGAAVGLAGALAAGRVMESVLYRTDGADPVTLAVVPLVLAGVALAAILAPARRASRVDPVEALRAE